MRRHLVRVVLGFVVLAGGHAWGEDLPTLRAQWEAERYADVMPRLLQFREKELYGRDPEVDYMIGTCCCRLPGQEDIGRKFFRWILYSYSLDDSQREIVRAELDQCARNAAPARIAFDNVRSGSGSIGVRGKTYYPSELLASDPVRVLRKIPRSELDGRLFALDSDDAATRVRERIGGNAVVSKVGRFVFATTAGHRPDDLAGMGRGLQAYADSFASSYRVKLPDRLITIYLVDDPSELQRLADWLHGIHVPRMSLGYSFRDDLSVVAIVPADYHHGLDTGAPGTVAHELFHLLARGNFGDIPSWLDEGMAALMEVSELRGGVVRGLPNWRGKVLKGRWADRPSVDSLVRMSWASFDDVQGKGENPAPAIQAANHAMARYFILYLQTRDSLRGVYDAFRARKVQDTGDDPAAASVALLERVLRKPLAEVDRDFVTWFNETSREL